MQKKNETAKRIRGMETFRYIILEKGNPYDLMTEVDNYMMCGFVIDGELKVIETKEKGLLYIQTMTRR